MLPTGHCRNGHGNPTKHNMHRKLIDTVKKCEVRGEGAESKVKRALTIPELYKELEMLRVYEAKHNDHNYSLKYTAMTLWQYHLIGRIDDVCNFGMANPMGNCDQNYGINGAGQVNCRPCLAFSEGDGARGTGTRTEIERK